MEVEFEDARLSRLEIDPSYTAGFERSIVRSYRLRIQLIRAAIDERAFYAMKSLHFEKLKGDREGQYSMRLNAQWRLVIKIRKTDEKRVVVVVGIADYH